MAQDSNDNEKSEGSSGQEFGTDSNESPLSSLNDRPAGSTPDASPLSNAGLVQFPRKNPEALSIDSPPPSDDEDELEEVRPLRRIFTGRKNTGERSRSPSYASGRRNSLASSTRNRQHSSAANSDALSEEHEDEIEAEEREPRLNRSRSHTPSQNALLERYLEQIEREDDTESSFFNAVFETLAEAVKQIIKPEFFRFDYASLKIVFRTWACGWIGLILMVIRPVERWIGSTSFLLPLIGLLSSPGGLSVSNASVNVILEAAFPAWGLLCAYVANVIQWAARGYPTKQGIMAELAAEGICKYGDAKCLREVVITGRYLRFDITVITIFQLAFSIWVPGLAEQYYMRLFKIPFVMNLLMLLPVIPSQNATPYISFWELYRSSIIALYLAYAIKLVSCYIIFPISSNWKYVNILASVTKSTKKLSEDFFNRVHSELPSNDTFEGSYKNIPGECAKLSNLFFKFDMDGLMLKIEVSYSRLDAGDIGELRSRVREVLAALNSVHFFLINMQNRKEILNDTANKRVYEKYTQESLSPGTPKEKHFRDIFNMQRKRPHDRPRYKPTGKFEFQSGENWRMMERDSLGDLTLEDLDKVYSLIIGHYHRALVSANNVLEEVGEWLTAANSYRLRSMLPFFREAYAKTQKERADSLANAVQELENCHSELLKGFADYRTKVEGITTRGTAPYLFILAQDSLMNLVGAEFLNRVHRLARYCGHLDHAQSKPRWLNPFGTTRAKSMGIALFSLGANVTDQSEVSDFVPVHQVEVRNPDATLPHTRFHRFAVKCDKVVKWFCSPMILFNTKRAFAVNIPFIIFYNRETILFGFKCHAIWVSIIFVMTCSRQAVDGAYGLITRLYATFWGCILGLLIWYISSGNGHGNSYGLAVTCAFGFIIIAMHRHFNSDKVPLGSIVFCVTVILVIGNSWATTYAPPVGSAIGRGWRVGWLRFVTVSIGVTLAFIVTMFPVPATGKRAIREGLGVNQQELGETLSSIVNFALQRMDNPQVHVKRRADPIHNSFKLISNQILAASRLASLMKFEPAFIGVWPGKRYRFLIAIQQEIASLQSLTLLLLNKVEYGEDLTLLMDEMGISDVELLSTTYAVFYMTANALLTKKALPSITPGGLYYRHWKHFAQLRHQSQNAQPLLETASEMYTTYDGRLRLAGMMVSNLLYDAIDGSMLIVKGLVGEAFDTDEKIYFMH
ncbi:Uncharacterized protein C57A7.05 [Wickerhamiella sorbophila]|uniref:Uncharacterized protein C57A7.05 n=1 Tax=Wickerhamiella sorbophila TaxID=45607 RepID=A0A2T0FFC0_9ASCO|nr:Uncharacterized protein C57A7.05 [Wickerhamiella sorbophila]PRT53670.1 Uncharacterized protein C57A7.05 [Wickerhamiella sorbophila]